MKTIRLYRKLISSIPIFGNNTQRYVSQHSMVPTEILPWKRLISKSSEQFYYNHTCSIKLMRCFVWTQQGITWNIKTPVLNSSLLASCAEGYKAANLTTSCSAPFVATLHKDKSVLLKFPCVWVSFSWISVCVSVVHGAAAEPALSGWWSRMVGSELSCSAVRAVTTSWNPPKHLAWGRPHSLASLTIMGRIWRSPTTRFSKGWGSGDFPHDSLALKQWIHLGHEDKLSLEHFLAVVLLMWGNDV